MISMITLSSSADAARYHDSALVADGQEPAHHKADNYYANETAHATWQGEGARIMGIEGEKVAKEDFVNLLEGRLTNPKDGSLQDLSKNSKGAERRLGYDFTISAPKSVSIIGLVGGDERVVKAHNDANAAAMNWLQAHGAQIRVKDANGGNRTVQTGNLLYATVQHETSRANDPALHNHNVIVAVSYDKDRGEWRSLTNDELLKIRALADSVYKNTLALELKKAGYELNYADNGRDFEIRGVTPDQIKAFSERSRQIEDALIKRGIDPESASHAARQSAALDSRAVKNDLTKPVLQEVWSDKALSSGLNLDKLVSQSKALQVVALAPAAAAEQAKQAVDRAVEHLSVREQSFKVTELETAAIFFGSGNVGMVEVQKDIKDRLAEKTLVERESKHGPMLTTSVAISQELTLQDNILRGRGNGTVVVSSEAEFSTALAAFESRKTEEVGKPFKLSVEQVNAARNVLMHADKFQGVQGDAGTGKTAALEFVEEVTKAKGWEVLGMATSSTGAKELQDATGIKSQTVAAFMIERDKQLKMLQSDLDKLSVTIAGSSAHAARVKLVERRDLNLADQVPGAGPARYVFDNKSGLVFKSDSGPMNPLNIIGQKMTDAGNRLMEDTNREWGNAERFGDRFLAGAAMAAGNAQAAVGRSLTSYEQVGTTEAHVARSAHGLAARQELNDLLKVQASKIAHVENLKTSGNVDGRKILLVLDESSMTGTKDSARLLEIANDLGARVVLQGDVKQHGSVAAGRAFMQVQQAGINLSKIEETRRFDNATPQTKGAIEDMKLGQFSVALGRLDTTEVDSGRLFQAVAERYIANREELVARGVTEPKVGIVTMTNKDRKASNLAVRSELQKHGLVDKEQFRKAHLDDPKMTSAEQKFVPSLQQYKVDRMTALTDYKNLSISKDETLKVIFMDRQSNTMTLERANGVRVVIDPSKFVKFKASVEEDRFYAVGDKIEARGNIGAKKDPNRITNGTRGVVAKIDDNGADIKWQDGKFTRLTNEQMQHVDHAYAHTTFKEQGVTNERQIIAVSTIGAMVINREAAYVAASRAKGNTEIVTSAKEKMLENAGKVTTKTTAIDIGDNLHVPRTQATVERTTSHEQVRDTAPVRHADRTQEQVLGR